MPGGPFDWLIQALGLNPGSEANPIPLPGLRVIAPRRGTNTPEALAAKPFVRDTLYALAGGPPSSLTIEDIPAPPAIIQMLSPGYRKAFQGGNLPSGDADPFSGRVRLSPDLTLFPGQQQDVLIHEMGHMADFRDKLPGMDMITYRNYPGYAFEHPTDYVSASPAEYQAELFKRALTVIRHSNEMIGWAVGDGMSVDEAYKTWYENDKSAIANYTSPAQRLPGLEETIRILRQHPVFRDTPLGQMQLQAEQPKKPIPARRAVRR